jgi:predicted dehydrogenase
VAIKIGLAGAGHQAVGVHAAALSAAKDADFAAVWAPRVEAARGLAERHGATAYQHFDDMLDQVDAVVFAVPPAVQPDLAGIAAARGKAVLLEIPVAADIAGAEELSETIQTAGVVSQVALFWRYASEVRRFLTTSAPRTRPQGGSARLASSALAPGSGANPWRVEMGVLRTLGPHLLDMLDAALGSVGEVRAHADPGGWVGLNLEHEEGRFSEVSMNATDKVDVPRADIEIYGSSGSASIECEAAARLDATEIMYDEFVAAAAAGSPHPLDVQRGLYLQRISEEAVTDLIRNS